MPNKEFRDKTNFVINEMSLYKPVSFTEDNIHFWEKLLKSNLNILVNMYCVECEQDTTFDISNPKTAGTIPKSPGIKLPLNSKGVSKPKPLGNSLTGIHLLKFSCRNSVSETHLAVSIFLVKDNQVIKVGQYPSIADLEFPQYKKYRKLLGSDYKNLTKAVGLYASGIGIGSFVYLRRIFENLIFETFNKSSLNVSETIKKEFEILKMNEKINKLKDFLPDEIVENKLIYPILSKGIHELSEDECKEYFPVLKTGIEIILDYKLEEQEREKKSKELHDSLSQIKNKHS